MKYCRIFNEDFSEEDFYTMIRQKLIIIAGMTNASYKIFTEDMPKTTPETAGGMLKAVIDNEKKAEVFITNTEKLVQIFEKIV